MLERVFLFDEHHPDEPLEAQVEELSQTELVATVANTRIKFRLLRSTPELPFEGTLGGRDFVFNPTRPGSPSIESCEPG